MKKIDFNIKLPDSIKKEKVFNEAKFKVEHPDLYEEYLIGDDKEPDTMEIVKNWISSILSRAINKIDIDKDGREKATQTGTMEMQCNFSRVINAVTNHKDGWVKMEDADFKFLCDKWKEAKIPCQENIALVLYAINEAIEHAKNYKGNPDKC